MNRVNPKFVLRNHLAQTAIERAQHGDFGEVQRLLKVLERPFDEQPEHAAYADHPPAWARPDRGLLLIMTMHKPHDHDDPRYPVKKTDAEWRAAARPDAVPGGAPRRHRARLQRQVLGPRRGRQVPLRRLRHAAVRVRHQVRRRLRLAELLRSRSTARSSSAWSTRATAWCASRCAATAAARTWGMCSRTAPSPPASASASTRPRSTSKPTK